MGAVDWLAARFGGELPIWLFGDSTGAVAALVAAAERPSQVAAVVSRGGRPDLAGPALDRVSAPTLLIVGSADPQVLTDLGPPCVVSFRENHCHGLATIARWPFESAQLPHRSPATYTTRWAATEAHLPPLLAHAAPLDPWLHPSAEQY